MTRILHQLRNPKSECNFQLPAQQQQQPLRLHLHRRYSIATSASRFAQSTNKTHSRTPKRNHKSTYTANMKRVLFNDEATTVHTVISIDDMTKKEREAVWITPQEERQSQQNIVATIFSMRQQAGGQEIKSIDQDDISPCVRGLEQMYSASLTRQLKASKDIVINAVLDEQEAQESEGRTSLDHDAIARVSSTLSQGARDRAIMFGASDEASVRRMRPSRLALSGLCVASKSA